MNLKLKISTLSGKVYKRLKGRTEWKGRTEGMDNMERKDYNGKEGL